MPARICRPTRVEIERLDNSRDSHFALRVMCEESGGRIARNCGDIVIHDVEEDRHPKLEQLGICAVEHEPSELSRREERNRQWNGHEPRREVGQRHDRRKKWKEETADLAVYK